MKARTWIALAALLLASGIGIYIFVGHAQERRMNSRIFEAFASVETVMDYIDSPGFIAADQSAREKIFSIASSDLNSRQHAAIVALGNCLDAVEVYQSTQSLEARRDKLSIVGERMKIAGKLIDDL
jgi:hypothetical protein